MAPMLDKIYTPQDIESKLYNAWEKSGAFEASTHPHTDPKKNFCIMMPPPNVTGNLHMGHALNYTLQDILVRYHRMRGFTTLWQPGTDHAGIATQMIVERQIAAEGKTTRLEMGREKFLERVWAWKEESGGAIVNQQRRLGVTPDWKRQRFTMDKGLSTSVRKIFVEMHKDGLIYRNKRLVNWDPKLLTAVSDLEVDNIDKSGNLWYIKYDLEGTPGQKNTKTITVATTRPETLFGDTGIAVHPEDDRYKDLIGKRALVPFLNRSIPIVADEHSDPEKGTGAVKITPAHDFNDFEVGSRHNLEQITILDETAHLLAECVPQDYAGLDCFAARKKIVSDLESARRIEKVEKTIHAVPHGERSGVILEPRLTDQWFLHADRLAKEALDAAHDGRTKIMPESGLNTYNHWMKNIQPWCISRQLWWGHQIPAWYGPDGEIFVAETESEALDQAKSHYKKDVDLRQETDVLDTWFSSALWPFSTLGWPKNTEDLKKFYPTACLITAGDILFFWVARMMMVGLYVFKDVPFKDVFLHSLVRDSKGQKMSKTKGNVINPLDVMDKYGADALRYTMASFSAPGRDIKYADSLVETNRNFATKLWNAARFLDANGVTFIHDFDPKKVTLDINKWIISEFIDCLEKVEDAVARYRFNDMSSVIYHFAWGAFCDWYIEFSKPILFEGSPEDQQETKETLGWVLGQILHILNPIMPFITEELWQNLAPKKGQLITSAWPLLDDDSAKTSLKDPVSQDRLNWVIDLVTTIRSTRNDVNVPAGAKIPAILVLESQDLKDAAHDLGALICRLARLDSLTLQDNAPQGTGIVQAVLKDTTAYLAISNVIDIDAEKARLLKNLQRTEKEINILEKKLSNKKFTDKAPVEIIATNKKRLEEEESIKSKINIAIKRLT